MKPKVFARFDATMYFPGFGSVGHDNILNIDELLEIVKEFGPRDNSPRRVTISRKNCVVNMDKKNNNISLRYKDRYIDGHPIIAIETDAKIELVLPTLMYPNDVVEYLIKKYGRRFNFKPENFDPKTPVFLDVSEHISVGTRISEFSMPSYKKWHTVNCKPLSEKDIVVDKNLNQLWPIATGKPPVGLLKLFNQGKRR